MSGYSLTLEGMIGFEPTNPEGTCFTDKPGSPVSGPYPYVVERVGIEPNRLACKANGLPSASPPCAGVFCQSETPTAKTDLRAPGRHRTDDRLFTKQVLCQTELRRHKKSPDISARALYET